MRIDPDTKTVILEKKDCHCSTTMKRDDVPKGMSIDKFGYKICPKCKGTGRRGSGRCRECNAKDGYFSIHSPRKPGYVPDYKKFTLTTCRSCGGSWEKAHNEDLTDTLPRDVILDIPIEVNRSLRPQTWLEHHFGAGVYSCTDYGRWKDQSDEVLIEKFHDDVKHGSFPTRQATKYTRRDDMRLCDKLVILTNDNGYSILPVWETPIQHDS